MNLKYRYSIDLGGDTDGLFMSNYEDVAEYLGERLKLAGCRLALDICCGIGATTLPLAKKLDFVYGIDIDSHRINFARENALKYGVSSKTAFHVGNAMDLRFLSNFAVDAAVTDVDWARAGEEKDKHTSNLSETQPPMDQLFDLLKENITQNLAIRLSPSTDPEQIKSVFNPCEIEKIYIQSPLKELHFSFYYVYTGKLINRMGITKKQFVVSG